MVKKHLKKSARGKSAFGGKSKKVKARPSLRSGTKKDILVIVCFVLALLSLLSFFNLAGQFGHYFFKASQLFLGRGFFIVPVFFVLVGLALLIPRLDEANKRPPVYRAVFGGAFLFLLSILGIFHILFNQAAPIKAGGYLGFIFGYPLLRFLGFWAGLLAIFALLIISILITFNLSLGTFIGRLTGQKETESAKDKKIFPLVGEKSAQGGLWQKMKEKAREREAGREMAGKQEQIFGRSTNENLPVAASVSSETQKETSQSAVNKFEKSSIGFKSPPIEFLEKDKGQPTSGDIKANINIIKRTLENFGIEVEMAEVSVGPTVTQYTLRPAQGVKLSRITALQNDLSLALAAHPLRIEAPIPGRSLVGIEIPNRSVILVRLRSLLERPTFKEAPSSLTFVLGRDVAGNPMFADLAQMPHLLVAGATGTGKTIALNNIIVSLLYRNFPQTLKFIMIDPKRVELISYDNIPYLLTPVITQADKAIGALHWAVGEMERRFEILQGAAKRNIDAYNKGLAAEQKDQKLSYIVIIIDELADLMATRGRDVEAAIVRLAQMSRAVGIHLVVSTQRPSVEVITGLIKANITSRMAFQVASQIDSRTILDMAGAEKLLGNGDMLFLAGNSAKPRRLQGAYLSDKEIKKVADYFRKISSPEYNEELVISRSAAAEKSLGLGLTGLETDDELYQEAKKVIVKAGKASASLLQRRLRIGYARAARLLDLLEEKGVVGPVDGAKPREVFIDEGEEQDNF